MSNQRFLLALPVLSVLVHAQTVVPTSTLFLISGDQQRLTIVSGSTFSQQTATSNHYPIAVNNEIATMISRGANIAGSRYNLSGTLLGAAGIRTTTGGFFDGTTDGSHNYAFNFDGGNVYRFNTDWSGGESFITFGSAGQYLGITYDASDNTFWLSGWSTNQIVHINLSGTILGSFNANAFTGNLTALALDPVDKTLWVGSQNNRGVFAQYTRTGTLLGTRTYDTSDNILGGEFNFALIPEPGTTTLMIVGLLALLGRFGAVRFFGTARK